MSVSGLHSELRETERALLNDLRALRRRIREDLAGGPGTLSMGQKIADRVAATMGSWNFIIIQSTILFLWIVLNITAYIEHWDPYPFILLTSPCRSRRRMRRLSS
jgi:uncharacterized membrane protein